MNQPRRIALKVLRTAWRHFPGRPRFTFEDDGMATTHYSPFLDDQPFQAAYALVADRFTGEPIDARWRAWLLTRLARQCIDLGGNVAEFGTYRGACAALLLASTPMHESQRLFLFDTFAGIPAEGLTENEQRLGFEGRLADTSAEQVGAFLSRWSSAHAGPRGREIPFHLVEGDVTETVRHTEVGSLCFAHMDLNAAKATLVATDYAYERLVPGGILLFDDYGWRGYEDQRVALDEFFATREEDPIALPTGQAFVIRRARRSE